MEVNGDFANHVTLEVRKSADVAVTRGSILSSQSSMLVFGFSSSDWI